VHTTIRRIDVRPESPRVRPKRPVEVRGRWGVPDPVHRHRVFGVGGWIDFGPVNPGPLGVLPSPGLVLLRVVSPNDPGKPEGFRTREHLNPIGGFVGTP